MMNLNSTNEEIEALKYFLGEGNKAINQLLVSNAETDIAILNDDIDGENKTISYDREVMISNIMKIKALYTLILKQYYKDNRRKTEFFKGTNLSEIERLKNEPFIDKFVSAANSLRVAENSFASEWSRPTCVNIKLDSDIPYLVVKNVLEDMDTNDIIIAPFTKIKNYELSEEKQIENKNVKVYNIELEKQELDELEDRERFGLYNYILDNAYIVERKLEECIKLDKENEINYENIRKLEQLLIKYENGSTESDNEANEENSDISSENEYDSVERINSELDELKNTTTEIFAKRRDNINFINSWKRNIAVYMIAECKEIEKKFEDVEMAEQIEDPEEDIAQDEVETIDQEENIEDANNEDVSNDVIEEPISDEEASEEITSSEEVSDEANEETKLENEDVAVADETIVLEVEDHTDLPLEDYDDEEVTPTYRRVRNESKENIKAVEDLIKNIKALITKQQNHARIAGNIGSNYSALNNAFEMKNAAESMLDLIYKIDHKVYEAGAEDESDEKLEELSKEIIEISTLINYLNNPKIALKNTNVTRFEEMAIIEENELKRGIAEKIREIRGEAELKKLKDDLEILEDKTTISRVLGFFTGQNKLDEFMIDQIEIRQRAIRKNLSKKLNLAYNYSVHELMAEIEMFVDDNDDDYLVENDVNALRNLADELRRNYIISESKVHSIAQKRSGKNLPYNTKKMSKYDVIEVETYRFLNKYGYDIEVKNSEPKYQDTMASEISRIVEYINSSNIL